MLRSSFCSLVVATVLAAGPAAAQLWATQLEPGDFYVDLGGFGAYQSLPETENFLIFDPSGPVDGEDSLGIGGIRGGLGYVFDCDFLGENLRLEVAGHYAGGDNEDQFGLVNASSTIVDIDGSQQAAVFALVDSVIRTRLDYDTWGIDLLARTDFGDDGGLRVSPFIGFTHDREVRDEEASWEVPDLLANGIQHDLSTNHYGGVLGATLALPLSHGLWLSVEGRADLMYADAELDASQTNIAFPNSRVRDSESDFAARVGGSIALSRQFGPVVVGIEGFGSWLSWSPYAVYPLSDAGVPVTVADDDAWNAGGGLKVTVPF